MVGGDGDWVDSQRFLTQETIQIGWVLGIVVTGSESGKIVQESVNIFLIAPWHFVFLFCHLVGHECVLPCRRDFF